MFLFLFVVRFDDVLLSSSSSISTKLFTTVSYGVVKPTLCLHRKYIPIEIMPKHSQFTQKFYNSTLIPLCYEFLHMYSRIVIEKLAYWYIDD